MIAQGKAEWARILGSATQNEFEEAPLWSIDLRVEDEEKTRLEGLGLKPKTKDDHVFNFKQKLLRKDGTENSGPNVVDVSKQPWPEDNLVGNGSLVKVAFNTYEHKMTSQYGLGKGLQAVQVLEHVAYGGSGGVGEFADESEAVGEF
jgi:hypothetical protein